MRRVSQHISARTGETKPLGAVAAIPPPAPPPAPAAVPTVAVIPGAVIPGAPRVRELAPHALRRVAGRALTTSGLLRPTADLPRPVVGTGGLR